MNCRDAPNCCWQYKDPATFYDKVCGIEVEVAVGNKALTLANQTAEVVVHVQRIGQAGMPTFRQLQKKILTYWFEVDQDDQY